MKNKIKHVSQLYSKSTVSTDDLLSKVPKDCANLRDTILKNHHDIFKEKLGPEDRVNCPPVKLEIDHSRNIRPVKNSKAFDVPFHLRKSATAEFREMLKAGLVTETKNEASDWCSQAFPVRKPNSWPIKCHWVTDFRNLNKALKRPVWGGESSGQLLRHVEPTARFFVCFDAICGFHQVRVDEARSKLLNITTQMGNYRYTVLG